MGYHDELVKQYKNYLERIDCLIQEHGVPIDAFYYGIYTGKIKTNESSIAWLETTIEKLEDILATMEKEISRIKYKKIQGTYIPDKMKYL
jgi:hypothetical protein